MFLLITAALGPEPTLVSTVAPRQLGVTSYRSLPLLGQPLEEGCGLTQRLLSWATWKNRDLGVGRVLGHSDLVGSIYSTFPGSLDLVLPVRADI